MELYQKQKTQPDLIWKGLKFRSSESSTSTVEYTLTQLFQAEISSYSSN